ncbi:MAG: site-2 protease family protein [Arcobacter sp.]|nr:MAG: site-2 protease family protein [Arcobacter sp.]
MENAEIIKIAITIAVLIIAIVGHEIMHGLVAYKYGDHTAKDAGRLSINPIVHIDPIGTIVVPALLYISGSGFLFGWAKPVPISIQTVLSKGGYFAAMAVSLAGIFYNLVLALVASIVFVNYFPMEVMNEIMASNPEASTLGVMHYIISKMVEQDPFLYFVGISLILNLLLAVFNILPIPAFDGAQFITYLSLQLGFEKIAKVYIKLAPYGMFIVLAIFMIGPLQKILIFEPLNWLMSQLLL